MGSEIQVGPGCTYAGYAPTEFDPSAIEAEFGAFTPEFTIDTLRGRFTLSEVWGDCSMVTLVPLIGGGALLNLATMVDESEPNNIYLFFPRAINSQALVNEASETILEALRAYVRRFHFAARAPGVQTVLGYTDTVQTDYYIIDSTQRLRDAGSYSVFGAEGFVPQLAMSRFAAYWYNYERPTDQTSWAPWTSGYTTTDRPPQTSTSQMPSTWWGGGSHPRRHGRDSRSSGG